MLSDSEARRARQHVPDAASYAPVTVLIDQRPDGVCLSYDLMASLLAPYGEAWIASIDAVAALNPKIVVAGHKSVGAADLPEILAASQRYLCDFTTLGKKGGTVEDVVHGMLELHGERDQPHTLWISARAEVARRA